jgi:predicted PurR-regulated permease PerM
MDMRTKPNARRSDGAPVWFTRERVLVIALGLATLAVAYACWRIVEPFVPALTWALTLTIVAHPLHERLAARIKRPSLAAAIVSLIVTLAVALPLFYAGLLMAQQAVETAQHARSAIEDGSWKQIVSSYPALVVVADWLETQLAAGGFRDQVLTAVANGAKHALASSVYVATGALVTVFFLFYFLRDRAGILRALRQLTPLSWAETEEVVRDVRAMVKAMVYGTLAVALLQGTLGGLAFWWLGLPAPVLWGGVMALLSILPMFGAALVWVPVAAYLAATGDVTSALLLTAWGVLIVGLVDNVLKPVLVRGLVRVHTVPVFIAVLGGLFAFGATGILIGPIVLAVAIGLLQVWRRRFDDGESVEAGVNKR